MLANTTDGKFPAVLLCLATLVVLVASVTATGSVDDRQVNPQAAVLKAFSDRVHQYVDVQKKMESGLPHLSTGNDPAAIEAHRKALAEAIRGARRDARRGDVFGPAADQLRAIIHSDAEDRSLRDAYAAMQEVPRQEPPAVNAAYPEKAPLATVPPLLLKRLPALPDGLEYRFMGRDLILRDSKANLIVDFIHEAVPTIRR